MRKKVTVPLKNLYFTAYRNKEKNGEIRIKRYILNDVQKSDDGDAIDDSIRNVKGREGKKLS
jgi:hypothetical protein